MGLKICWGLVAQIGARSPIHLGTETRLENWEWVSLFQLTDRWRNISLYENCHQGSEEAYTSYRKEKGKGRKEKKKKKRKEKKEK